MIRARVEEIDDAPEVDVLHCGRRRKRSVAAAGGWLLRLAAGMRAMMSRDLHNRSRTQDSWTKTALPAPHEAVRRTGHSYTPATVFDSRVLKIHPTDMAHFEKV